ncbi:peptidoglycan recognition family protein [Elusimicrobiota bacterium]
MNGVLGVLLLIAVPGRAETVKKPAPHIYSRADWGAPARSGGGLNKDKVRIIIHHSDNPVDDETKALEDAESWEAAASHARNIRAVHRQANGWRDIGYHYLVDWDGRLLEGRAVDRLGSHTDKHNSGSIGIVLMGDFSRQKPTLAQVLALKRLCAWLLREHEIAPEEIYGHRDFNATECPGRNFYEKEDPDSMLLVVRRALVAETKLSRSIHVNKDLGRLKAMTGLPLFLPRAPVLVIP